jgi:transporter family-2 protein
MTWLWLTLVALAIGASLSVQPIINGSSAGILVSVLAAAALSLFISTVSVAVLFWLRGEPTLFSQLYQFPYWAVFGGLIGAAFVTGGAALVPVMGATVFFVCLIARQLLGAVMADSVGAFGMEARAFTMRKLAGVTLAFAGVVLVRSG